MEGPRASFLEAVLSKSGEVEVTELKARIADVIRNVQQLKVRVHDNLSSNFVDFDPLLKSSKGFFEKSLKATDDIVTLFNRIEFQTKRDLANSTGELSNLHASLKESQTVLSVVTELLQMENALKEIETACAEGQYIKAAKSLQMFKECCEISSPDTQQLDIFKSMLEEFHSLYEMFCKVNMDKLYNYMTWESKDVANHVVASTIKIKLSCSPMLQESIQALHLIQKLTPWMKKLKNFFLRSILLPFINNESSVSFEEKDEFSSMQVLSKITSRKPIYSATLDNLTKCFEFLHGELDIRFEDGDSFIGLLGNEIAEEFTENLIQNCLKETIPSSSAELDRFSGIRERVAIFSNYMTAIEFTPEENQGLMDYVQNFDTLCANRACENYLKNAREIMREDLQDMVDVGPQTPTLSLSSTLNNTSSDLPTQESLVNVTIRQENELNPSLFQFPSCFVSKSTLKILELVGVILNEVIKNPKENGLHHIYLATAKSVFELYMAVVPKIHQKLLDTIPQQVALFHNNCMYLAHRLSVLGIEVESSLQSVVKVDIPITFVDLVIPLRHLGTTIYLKHMQQQRKQILDLVKESGLATLGENSELAADTERTLRQCLRQLELLQSVWQNVLPRDVYCKSIGTLANAFMEELVVRVLSVEDISASTAVKLTSHFKMAQERIPLLFEDGSKVVLYVKRWLQFQELITILSASLRDIEKRWSEGKGPLAHEFTSEQVKQLVRALFQNTQRRAEVLSKIK